MHLYEQIQEVSGSWDSAKQDLKSKLQTALMEGVELLERVQVLEERLKEGESNQLSMLNEVRGPVQNL